MQVLIEQHQKKRKKKKKRAVVVAESDKNVHVPKSAPRSVYLALG